MCAIAGLLARTRAQVELIHRMAGLMAHRGPDDEGFMFHGPPGIHTVPARDSSGSVGDFARPEPDAWLALGHRRLSILDLSPLGHQPMAYRGRYWLVYNGEVYNYLELRTELEQAGHQFRSHCDTEVILAAYAEWGAAAFSRFNGMWALALYDAQHSQLLLSRDRFGIKPLYYYHSAGLFAFASEIKALTCLPQWRPRLNGQAAHDFLLTGLQDHSAETLFQGVLQLPPGCLLRLDCAAAIEQLPPVQRWYDLRPREFVGTPEEAARQFADLLLDSVRLRLRSDVPVGSCLSGGLDSSSIVCAAHRLLAEQQAGCAHQTFSACSVISRFDERPFIEQVIRATAVRSHPVFPSVEELFSELDQLIWHQDEPFAGTSIFAQWCVFKAAAAEKIEVMLDGQGADELLCGYNDFRRAFFCGLFRAGRPLLAWREARAARGNRRRALSACTRALADACIPLRAQSFFRGQRRTRRPPPWLNVSKLGASFPGRLAAQFRHHRSARELSLELLGGAHLQMLLHWEDRNSMAHSIESRVPFLDYRLVEFVTGLPDHYKIRNGVTKAVLRDAVTDLVPEAVLRRRDKMGFVTPEQVWIKEQAPKFRECLSDAIDASQGILAPETPRMLEGSFTGTGYDSALWRMVCFGAWLRRFQVAV